MKNTENRMCSLSKFTNIADKTPVKNESESHSVILCQCFHRPCLYRLYISDPFLSLDNIEFQCFL